jgi:hypothetical protein
MTLVAVATASSIVSTGGGAVCARASSTVASSTDRLPINNILNTFHCGPSFPASRTRPQTFTFKTNVAPGSMTLHPQTSHMYTSAYMPNLL